MLKISKKVEYALMALKFMATRPKEQLTSVREICDRFGAPFDTMSKVMQAMTKAKIVTSIQGVAGGYRPCCELSTLSYMSLARVVEKKSLIGPCHTEKGPCHHLSQCNIISPIDAVNQQVVRFLESVSLGDLLSESGAQKIRLPQLEQWQKVQKL